MKSVLYCTSHAAQEFIDQKLAEIRERGLKARKVDKVEEDGKTFYRIRIYFEKLSNLDRLSDILKKGGIRMEMKLKLAPGVQPTQNQALEIAQVVMAEPDITWEGDFETVETATPHHKSYDVESDGEFGRYHYRVNLSWELITILKIED